MVHQGLVRRWLLAAALASGTVVVVAATPADAADPPDGFVETTIATDIQNPVGMEVDTNGRIYVLAGNERRIEMFDDANGFIGDFLSLPQAANLGSGLLGFTFAPDFETSGDVYVSYVTKTSVVAGPQRFRVSRFASRGGVADPTSETVLFEVDDIDPSQQQHQGGDIEFGADGKLYWTLGDRVKGTVVAQSLDSPFGKVLRLNPDGSIPNDNPFYGSLTGKLRAIYALGLRNPYRMERHPETAELFMSEVGPKDWEELDQVAAGANYGWPLYSGVVGQTGYTDPVFAYNHVPDGCAITGGAFYIADVEPFPSGYHGDFFYGDHCFGWIAHFDPVTGQDERFMTGADRLVEIKVNPRTGSLYYLDREYQGDTDARSGGVGRIDFVAGKVALEITRQPSDLTAAIGEDVSFGILVSGQGPFSYQWYRDEAPVADSDAAVLAVLDVQSSDDGARFRVDITDAGGTTVSSTEAVLSVSSNTAPVPTITAPDADLRYVAGETYAFGGSAMDSEDGLLEAADLSWEIVFHHGQHTHPFIPQLDGVDGGTFEIPANDETSPYVFYRINLTATDSDGTSTTVTQDVLPLTVEVTLATDPAGLTVLLDGAPVSTPTTFTAVAGITRVLEAPTPQGQNVFDSWSDGGAREHAISTPVTDTTFVATFAPSGVDVAPAVTLGSPAGGSAVDAPMLISGTAGDDIGVEAVDVIIKRAGTNLYWDGGQFVSGWRVNPAVLSNPAGSSTDWSYSFAPPTSERVRISVRSVDAANQKSPSQKANATALVGAGGPPVVTLTSPANGSTNTDPVTFSGMVSDDDLDEVFIVIKRRGSMQYWNGATWQPSWARVPVDAVIGDQWSYELDLPVVDDVVAFARAVDATGQKTSTDKIVVFVR